MFKRGQAVIAAVVVSAFGTGIASAAPLYTENFDADHTANWQYNSSISGDTTSVADNGGAADYFFDYSTVGIPAAPGGTTTRGMKLEANLPNTGVFSGVSASPIGLNLPSQYKLTFDMWENTVGATTPPGFPAGGSSSTQLTTATVGVTGTDNEFAGGTITGVQYSTSGDGGTSQDYRAYNAAGAYLTPDTHPGVYAAGDLASSSNASDPYYADFGNIAPPAAQTALYPNQNGNVQTGAQAFAWHHWVITKTDNDISWSIDGKPIADLPASLFPTFGGNNIAFGQVDISSTSSSDPNAAALLFGLIDNVQVDAVPEPASLGLLGVAGLGLLRRRRHA